MAVYFIDIDGTIFKHSTQELLPGAEKMLFDLKKNYHTIVLTTRRGDSEWTGHPVYSKEATLKALSENKVPYDQILFDLFSPRIIVNDDGAFAFNHPTNGAWTQENKVSLLKLGV